MAGLRAPGIVLTQRDVDRVRHLAFGIPQNPTEARRLKLQSLKEASDGRVATWNNTIEAIRQKSIKARKQERVAAEDRQRAIDAAEAELRKKKREEVIRRAREIIFQNSDEAKKLASATLLSDVLKERELQEEVTKAIQKEQRRIDDCFYNDMQKKLVIADEQEAEKIARRKQERMEVAEIIRSQVQVAEQRKKREADEQLREGVKLRELAVAAHQEELDKIAKREEQSRVQKKEQFFSNQQLETAKLQERDKEVEYMRKIEEYAKQKTDMQNTLKAKVDERFRYKLAQRQKMIDLQVERMQNQAVTTEKLLKRDQEKKLQQEDQEADMRRHKKEKLAEAVRKSCENQRKINRRKKAAQDERRQDLADLDKVNSEAKQYEADQARKKSEQRERARELAAFHRKQIIEKREQIRLDDPLRNEAALNQIRMRKKTLHSFRQHAREVIREYEGDGKNIQPMNVALRHMDISLDEAVASAEGTQE